MCLARNHVSERRLDRRMFAVAIPFEGGTPGCLTKSRKPDLARRATATGAKIAHANDVLTRWPLPQPPKRPRLIPRLCGRDLNGRNVFEGPLVHGLQITPTRIAQASPKRGYP